MCCSINIMSCGLFANILLLLCVVDSEFADRDATRTVTAAAAPSLSDHESENSKAPFAHDSRTPFFKIISSF